MKFKGQFKLKFMPVIKCYQESLGINEFFSYTTNEESKSL